MSPHSSVLKYPTGGAGGVKPPAADGLDQHSRRLFLRNPSVLIFVLALVAFTVLITVARRCASASSLWRWI